MHITLNLKNNKCCKLYKKCVFRAWLLSGYWSPPTVAMVFDYPPLSSCLRWLFLISSTHRSLGLPLLLLPLGPFHLAIRLVHLLYVLRVMCRSASINCALLRISSPLILSLSLIPSVLLSIARWHERISCFVLCWNIQVYASYNRHGNREESTTFF